MPDFFWHSWDSFNDLINDLGWQIPDVRTLDDNYIVVLINNFRDLLSVGNKKYPHDNPKETFLEILEDGQLDIIFNEPTVIYYFKD